MAFDADTGRLDVAPEAPAYGTKLRWSAPKLITAANAKVPDANVRTLHVLPPSSGKAGPAMASAVAGPQPTMPAMPSPRPAPPDGYRRVIEAHRQAGPASRVDPAIAQAVERQTAALRALSRRVFPEPDTVAYDAPVLVEQARAERRRQAAATETAALRRARAEKARHQSCSVEGASRRAPPTVRHGLALNRPTGQVLLRAVD
ncbi:DUF721 domain-containing protein [Streptomyces sp900105755]|uniref:DUF721 domain-containing protein n=1 Tax=Streptomyces sp. 900105755 TaxID=3154389 RepID=A0ABV1TWW0_9ACTN